MKMLLTLLLSFGALTMSFAQDSWKLTHNGTVRVQAKEEDPEGNAFAVRIADFNKTGSLSVVFNGTGNNAGWIRTIMVVDESDTELATSKGSTFSISNARLRGLFKKSAILKVYTMAIPSDPKQAALVRVRRIHLATISFKK